MSAEVAPLVQPRRWLLSAREVRARHCDEPRWLIDQWLPASLTLLFGAPKAGKSWLAVHVADAVMNGKPFLGQPVEGAPGPVAWLTTEVAGERDIVDRLLAADIDDTHFLCVQGGPPKVRDEWTALAVQLATTGVRLLIVDNLQGLLAEGSVKDDDVVRPVIQCLGRVADHGVPVLLLHHTPNEIASRPLGSQASTALTRADWNLTGAGKLKITARDAASVVTLNVRVSGPSAPTLYERAQGSERAPRRRTGDRSAELIDLFNQKATPDDRSSIAKAVRLCRSLPKPSGTANTDGALRRWVERHKELIGGTWETRRRGEQQ